MISKRWQRREYPPIGFSQELGLPPFHSHLLYNRGVRCRSDVEPFFAADSRLLNDPMLLPDMDKAVARLKKALENSEIIGVFGDFDTDGITGTALLTRALRDLGASVIPYIPDRVDEGHGLNDDAVRYLQEQGVSLLITVDCGATSIEEVDMASSLGIDTIITDHHSLLPAMPDSHALINPKHPDSEYPYGELTGVGMSFKLVEALYTELGQPWPEHLLDLVALGTVADVGPLTGENKFLVKKGLDQLNTTQNPGIQALIASARLKMGALDTESLSFGLIPRLNVAGRLGHAGISLELLTTSGFDVAQSLASKLEKQNYERQMMTEEGFREAQWQVESAMNGHGVPPILIVKHDDWSPGILGLIASRLSEQYYRPAVAISTGEEVSRASARSIHEFNIVAALEASKELFVRFGGHPQAAGFTIPTPSIPELEGRLYARADEELQDADLAPFIDIDCEVPLSMFTRENFDFIQSLAPFGAGNPSPVFLTRRARVVDSRLVGAEGKHLKMRVWHEGSAFGAIAFRQGHKVHETRSAIDLVYSVGIDNWGGRPKLQLTVQDFKASQ